MREAHTLHTSFHYDTGPSTRVGTHAGLQLGCTECADGLALGTMQIQERKVSLPGLRLRLARPTFSPPLAAPE